MEIPAPEIYFYLHWNMAQPFSLLLSDLNWLCMVQMHPAEGLMDIMETLLQVP